MNPKTLMIKKIYTFYQTNSPNILGGFMTYNTLSEAFDPIGHIGFDGKLIDIITAVTMWHGHRTGYLTEILSQGVIYKLKSGKI